MRYDNLFIFSISSTLSTGHFNQYFIDNCQNLYLFLMPLSNQESPVKLFHYEKSRLIEEKEFYLHKNKKGFLRFLFFYLYYLYTVFFILPKKTLIFATAPQYCMLSSLFDFFKQIKVVYHVGDYYPKSKGLVKIYQFFIHYYNDHMKYVVYCSPLLEKLLRKNKPQREGNREHWVFGIETKSFKKNTENNLLGYIGVLRPGQGIDIIFGALKENKRLKLEVIGDGPWISHLKDEVQKLNLRKQVEFLGLIQNNQEVLRIVSRWQIGLAPYEPNTSNMTYFGDPSKVKFYLEYKLPVIITKITYMAEELRKYNAGVCINYDSKSLIEAINKIQMDYNKFLKGTEQLASKYEYKSYYENKFKFFNKIFKP